MVKQDKPMDRQRMNCKKRQENNLHGCTLRGDGAGELDDAASTRNVIISALKQTIY